MSPAEVGYWLAPHSGRLLAPDGSNGMVPVLSVRDVHHPKVKGKGVEALRRSGLGLVDGKHWYLASGHTWSLEFVHGELNLANVDPSGVKTELGKAKFKGGTFLADGRYQPAIVFKHKSGYFRVGLVDGKGKPVSNWIQGKADFRVPSAGKGWFRKGRGKSMPMLPPKPAMNQQLCRRHEKDFNEWPPMLEVSQASIVDQ